MNIAALRGLAINQKLSNRWRVKVGSTLYPKEYSLDELQKLMQRLPWNATLTVQNSAHADSEAQWLKVDIPVPATQATNHPFGAGTRAPFAPATTPPFAVASRAPVSSATAAPFAAAPQSRSGLTTAPFATSNPPATRPPFATASIPPFSPASQGVSAPAPSSHLRFTILETLCMFLIGIGLVLVAYYVVGFPASSVTAPDYQNGFGFSETQALETISRLNQKQNGMTIGIGISLLGALIYFPVKNSRPRDPSTLRA